MGMYRSSAHLEKYLDKYTQVKFRKIRQMSPEELDVYGALDVAEKDFNVLTTELFCTLAILRTLENADMEYIIVNLRRIVNSLVKQRNKIFLVRKALSTYAPEPEEFTDIKYFRKACDERIRFLRVTVLPENLKLTPIAEYLQIIGKDSMREVLLDRFKTGHALYAMNSGEDPESLNAFVSEILQTVSDAGRLNEYEIRLKEYIDIVDSRRQKKAEEDAARKLQENLKIAQDEMLNFQRLFHNAVFKWKSCEKIHMGKRTIESRINRYGRGIFFILCCYVARGRVVYRYIGSSLRLGIGFATAHVYKEEADAKDDLETLRKANPDKVFEIIEFSHMEKGELAW